MNSTELVQSYRQQIGNVVNQANLQLFWNIYNRCGQCGARQHWDAGPPVFWGTPCYNHPWEKAGRQCVEEQIIEPPRGLASCPGSHPSRSTGGAALQPTLVLGSSTPPLGHCRLGAVGDVGDIPDPNNPEPQCRHL